MSNPLVYENRNVSGTERIVRKCFGEGILIYSLNTLLYRVNTNIGVAGKIVCEFLLRNNSRLQYKKFSILRECEHRRNRKRRP